MKTEGMSKAAVARAAACEPLARITANAHTHTTWCDGKNSAEEMVRAALAAGFQCIGFSGHSYTWFDESYAMSLEGTKRYRQEIRRLAQAYRGQIDIRLGTEWDWHSQDTDPADYDYVIGSCHYLYSPVSQAYYTIDYTPQELKRCLQEGFDGDADAMVCAYYKNVAEMATQRRPDIVGHLDLLRKLNAQGCYFDETAPGYLKQACRAADACMEAGCIIEINTGGVYKGYRDTPYPAEPILRYIARSGGKITVNSDAHDAKGIDFMFSEALQLAKDCGFSSLWQLTADGMKEFSI